VKGAGVLSLLAIAAVAEAQPVREVRFTGDSAVEHLCACLLDARRTAEQQGRLDFAAEVAFTTSGGPIEVTARIRMGSPHGVGRITFAGNAAVNDSTLRRAMLIYEREVFDVGKLRRSLARINDTGLFAPLTLADVSIDRRNDGVTADVTIALREPRRRWWSFSGPVLPGLGSFHASIASRLPPWGRGLFDASTFVVRLNLLGLVGPAATAFPLLFERPQLPGQELLSGFVIAPSLSPRAALTHYGRTHLARVVKELLDVEKADALAVPVTSGAHSDRDVLVCDPPKPRLWWLRRSGAMAMDLVLNALE
jgi:hypothetical protein